MTIEEYIRDEIIAESPEWVETKEQCTAYFAERMAHIQPFELMRYISRAVASGACK